MTSIVMAVTMNAKKHKKAEKEIMETMILTDYLLTFNMDFDDPSNFTDKRVREAKLWKGTTELDG